MKHLSTISCATSCVLLAACTDYATFVTSTDIGISADANTQELHLGYIRTELFTGPGYPDKGEAPAAVGYIGSNLSAFSPKIKQLYATGKAAELVSQIQEPDTKPATADGYEGERRPLVFGTGTNLGLQVGFAGGTTSKVKFGYNREELSIIPLHREPTSKADKYAPVLAAIDMDQTVAKLADTEVKLTQFFATGTAAQNIARRSDIRAIFASQAGFAVEQAAITEAVNRSRALRKLDDEAISVYFDKYAGTFEEARDRLIATAGLASDAVGAALRQTADKSKFLDYLQKHPTVIPALAPAASKLSS
jgi:hypothetical protein